MAGAMLATGAVFAVYPLVHSAATMAACAVSRTRQTTTAPISTGLPRWSFTFSGATLRLRERSERRPLRASGLAPEVRVEAISRSSAVPGLFAPVGIAGREYVDGGLVAPVPVQQARDMGAEVVLAVDISSAPEGNLAVGNIRVLLQTFAIMGQSINRLELGGADLVVRPALAGVGSADFASRQRSIEAGRAAMTAALPRLKALLERRVPL